MDTSAGFLEARENKPYQIVIFPLWNNKWKINPKPICAGADAHTLKQLDYYYSHARPHLEVGLKDTNKSRSRE